jgi:hypothetical protein
MVKNQYIFIELKSFIKNYAITQNSHKLEAAHRRKYKFMKLVNELDVI